MSSSSTCTACWLSALSAEDCYSTWAPFGGICIATSKPPAAPARLDPRAPLWFLTGRKTPRADARLMRSLAHAEGHRGGGQVTRAMPEARVREWCGVLTGGRQGRGATARGAAHILPSHGRRILRTFHPRREGAAHADL